MNQYKQLTEGQRYQISALFVNQRRKLSTCQRPKVSTWFSRLISF